MMVMFLSARAHAQPKEEDRRYRLAQGYENSGDLRNASRVYRELYDADPQSELYFEAVRRTYSALGLNAELLPLVTQRLTLRPNDFELRVTLADLLYRTGKHSEAIDEWKRALENGGYQDFVYAIVAASQTDNHAYDLAIESYRNARDRSDDRLLFADQLAILYITTGHYEEATREYLGMLGADPDRIGIVKRAMAQIAMNPTGLAAATRVVESAVQRNPDFEPSLDLLSWLYDEGGNHAGAFDVAKRLDAARGGRGSNVFAYADRALREGRIDAAIAALDYFMATYGRDNPLYSVVLLSYARALEERHRADGTGEDGARSLVQRYLDLAEREEGSEVAAEALLRAARLRADELDAVDDAVETLDELIAAPKNTAVLGEALVLLGELRVRENELDKASELFDRAATSAGDDIDVYNLARLRRAEIALYRGEYKRAVDSLTELTRITSSEITNDALAYLFLLQENFETNDVALGHYVAGRLQSIQRKWSDAIEEFEKAVKSAPSTMLVEEATLARAEAQSRTGAYAVAVDSLISFITRTPEALIADRALFRAAQIVDQKLSDPAKAIELYLRLLNEYPRSQHAAASRARIRELRNG